MNWRLDHSQNNDGIVAQYTFDLSKEKPAKFIVSPSLLEYERCSVEAICNTCVGTSGSIRIHETNNKGGGSSFNYDTGVSVALGETTNNYVKVNDVLSQYLAFELPPTVGNTGMLTLVIVAK